MKFECIEWKKRHVKCSDRKHEFCGKTKIKWKITDIETETIIHKSPQEWILIIFLHQMEMWSKPGETTHTNELNPKIISTKYKHHRQKINHNKKETEKKERGKKETDPNRGPTFEGWGMQQPRGRKSGPTAQMWPPPGRRTPTSRGAQRKWCRVHTVDSCEGGEGMVTLP